MNKLDIVKFVKKYNISSRLIDEDRLIFLLKKLQNILEKNIPGDLVELGCNIGTTTIFIKRLLNYYKSDKKLYVYDSWKGLPEKNVFDFSNGKEKLYEKGCYSISKNIFIDNLIRNNISTPNIYSGNFKDISDTDYPDKICFGVFDGHFYTSILDSFKKIYNKVQIDGEIIIIRYGDPSLPGIKKACADFLFSKDEIVEQSLQYNIATVVKQ